MASEPKADFNIDQWSNQSERAQGVLEHILHEEDPEGLASKDHLIAVAEAKRATKIIDIDTDRSKSRVLFVTADVAALEDGSANQRDFSDLSSQFDEVHILVLKPGSRATDEVRRLDNGVWIYTATGTSWWGRVFNAWQLAIRHLQFNESVRPDVIVAHNAGLATLVAYVIGRVFKRSVQVHLYSDDSLKTSFIPGVIYRYALRRVHDIRTSTEKLLLLVRSIVPKRMTVSELPVFENFSRFAVSKIQFDLREKYSDYTFFILAEGELVADGNLHDVFTILRTILFNPKILLVIIGEGPAKSLFVEKAKLLGVSQNVIFCSQKETDIISCYKTADVLLETGTNEASERRILQAVMAELPVVAYETNLRTDLFEDGDSAYLAPVGDMLEMTQKMNRFLNQAAIRTRFSRRERDIATSRIQENPIGYQRAMRDVIESVILREFNDEIANDASAGEEPDIQSESSEPAISQVKSAQ